MPTEEKSTMDLLEECERKNYEEILKLDPGDQNIGKYVNNARTYADIRTTYDKAEQDRLNNYAKNEQAEWQQKIDMEKLKIDNKRANSEYIKPVLYFLSGMIGGAASFLFDPLVSKWKPFEKFQERCGEFINRK